MIDLHSHTTESDGTLTPEELISAAIQTGITTLAITDHDTFAGYDRAVPHALASGLELLCGIEISAKFDGQSLHILGYFPDPKTTGSSRSWILDLQRSRSERNVKLVELLQKSGVPITLADVQTSGVTGRPHFARWLIKAGFASSMQEAFDKYLSESGLAYVERSESTAEEALRQIRRAQGISSLAHPVRIKGDWESLLPRLHALGLDAVEAYHSDHSSQDTARLLQLAADLEMPVTGGSDFHGDNKPEIALGTGRNGNVRVPDAVLQSLRQQFYS